VDTETVWNVADFNADPDAVADGVLTVTVEDSPDVDADPVALPDCVVAVIVTNEPLALALADGTPPEDAIGADASGRAANSIRPLR
jgi:hypothetical protein